MNTQTDDTAVTLDETIDNVLAKLDTFDPTTDDYATMVDQLTKLYKMKEIENNFKLKLQEMNHNYAHGEVEHDLKFRELDNFNRISKAQLATILANLAGIAVIMSHERTHIIVTKALGFVSKLK